MKTSIITTTSLALSCLLTFCLIASSAAAAPVVIFSTGELSGARGSNKYFDFTLPPGLESVNLRVKAYPGASGTGQAVATFGRVPTEEDLDNGLSTIYYPPPGTWHLLVHGTTSYRGVGIEAVGTPDSQPYARYAGTFSGIMGTSEFVTLTLMPTGAFTGKILLPGGFGIFKGAFNANGDGSSESPNLFSLQISSASGGNDPGTAVIAGSIAGRTVSAWHTAYRRGDKAPEAGKYTVLLSPTQTGTTLPPGTGFGAVTIAPSGGVRTSFKLADGTALTGGSALQGSASGKHQFVFYPPTFYKNVGRLVGMATIQALAGSDLDGAVGWIKNAPGAAYYGAAIDTTLSLTGARYVPRPRGFAAVDFPAGADNIRATLKGGGLPGDIATTGSWSDLNVVTIGGANPVSLKVVVNIAAGNFSGSFVHPASGKPAKFSGALFQKPQAPKAAGFFLGPINAGTGSGGGVTILPR